MDLGQLKTIIARGNFTIEDVFPFLIAPDLKARIEANFLLGEYYYNRREYERAEVFIERVFILSHYDLKYVDCYLLTLQQLKKTEKARAVLKYAMRKELERKNYDKMLQIANIWQSVYMTVSGLDLAKYDFEIYEMVQQAADAMPGSLPEIGVNNSGKIKVGYLIYGYHHPFESILVTLNKIYAEFHDRAKFEVYFIIPLSPNALAANPYAKRAHDFLVEHGVQIILYPEEITVSSIFKLAGEIRQIGLDILNTSAGPSDMRNYFLLCLRPARKIIGYILGMVPLFAAPAMDLAICWRDGRSPMETPLDLEMVNFTAKLPDKMREFKLERSALGIGKEGIIIASAGRATRYRDAGFWQVIDGALSTHANCFFLLVGPGDVGKKAADKYVAKANRKRILVTELIPNDQAIEHTNLCDIYIDSFPVGGGMSVYEAMALQKPIISVKEDLFLAYDPISWMGIAHMVDMPECFFDKEDIGGMLNRISEWIEFPEKRHVVGKKCEEEIRKMIISPEKHTRQVEEIYMRLMRHG